MKINVGVVTTKLTETRDFYINHFGLTVKFESEWFVLLETDEGTEVAFMLPNMEGFHLLFKSQYSSGVWLTINVRGVDNEYERVKQKDQIEIIQEIKTEVWGERHFVIRDPNNVAVDIVEFVGTDTK